MQQIALCLTGHFRNFEIAWPYLKRHVIDPYQPDVFGFAWGDTFGDFMHARDKSHASFRLGYDPSSAQIDPSYAETVVKRLVPKSMEIHDPREIDLLLEGLVDRHRDVEPDWEWHRPKSKYQMMYGRARCNQLRQEYEAAMGISYEKIIFTRWDIVHENALPTWTTWDTRLLLPMRYAYGGGPSDIWAVGTGTQIDCFANLLDNIDTLKQTPGFKSDPHHWLRDNLAHTNTEWLLCDIPVMIANRPF